MTANRPAPRSVGSNVGNTERIGSVIAGSLLLARAALRPTRSAARYGLAAAGIALLQRGVTGRCLLYRVFGIDTTSRAERAIEDDAVLRASEDSFPASDPPAWTPVRGTLAR